MPDFPSISGLVGNLLVLLLAGVILYHYKKSTISFYAMLKEIQKDIRLIKESEHMCQVDILQRLASVEVKVEGLEKRLDREE